MMRGGQKYLFQILVAVICVAFTAPVMATSTFKVTKTLYVDGQYVGSVEAPFDLAYTFDRVILACEGIKRNMYNNLDGALDEFAIYDVNLPLSTIQAHYALGDANDEPNYVKAVQADNPLLYLRLDDPITTNGSLAFADPCSRIQRNGTYISNNITQVTGIFNGTDKAAKFAGNSAKGCVDILDRDRALSFEEGSVEVWVKSTALGTDHPRLFQHNGRWQNQWAYGVMTEPNDVNGMQIGVIGGSSTDFFDVNSFDINDGNWHHIVVAYHDAVAEPNGYPNEISLDNPLIWFRFEEEMGEDVNVVNYGSLAVEANYIGPDPYFAPGKVDKGCYLSGSPGWECICIFSPGYDGTGGDNSHSYALTPGDMSVELWFRSELQEDYEQGGATGWARLYSNNGNWRYMEGGRSHLTGNGYSIVAGSQKDDDRDCPYFYFEDPKYDPNTPDPCDTGPGDHKWHHVVAMFNVNDVDVNSPPLTMSLYVDGALLGSTLMEPNVSESITGVLGPEFREFLIGAEATSAGRYNCLKGTVDEFALYGYLLSPERIALHYREGMAGVPWVPETCEQIYKFGWEKSADKSGNCRIGFEDMKEMGIDWWRCIEPSDGSCEKPWLL